MMWCYMYKNFTDYTNTQKLLELLDEPGSPALQADDFTIWATRETWTMINAAKYLCLISFSVPLFLLWTSNRFSFFTFGDQMQRNLLVTPYILAVLSGSVQLCLFHSNIECLQKFWFKWEKSSNDHFPWHGLVIMSTCGFLLYPKEMIKL